MIEKLTPDQLKAVFDLSDTSDVTKVDHVAAREKTGCLVGPYIIRLLKHYHPEIFVDPRLEAAKKIAREIVAEEYDECGLNIEAEHIRNGIFSDGIALKATIRALLMDPPTGDGDYEN